MRNSRPSSLLAVAFMMAAALPATAVPVASQALRRISRRATPTTAKAREIAEWNAAVEARKAERLARRRG